MKLFDLLKWFAQPVVRFILALLGPVGILLGAIANPAGAVNGFVCRIIDLVAAVWPSTPESLKIGSLLGEFFVNNSETIGGAVVHEIYSTAVLSLGLILLIKLYKLIPFKAT